jgi:hypothetical protein
MINTRRVMFCCAIWGSVLALFSSLVNVATAGAQPTVSAPPMAPTVVLDAMPDRESVERQEPLEIFLIVNNRSDAALERLTFSLPNGAFQQVDETGFPSSIPAFGSRQQTITLCARRDAAFGQHRLPVVVEYTWRRDTTEVRSAQTVAVSVQVRRRFEEEAKGFPGGTAAFLYLLLPVIPAFLSYETIEHLRKGEGLQVPTFRNEHIAFAFLLAVVLSFLMVIAAHRDINVTYSDPLLFVAALGISAFVGAVVPSLRWLRDIWLNSRWAFRNGDTAVAYLRKALLGPRTPKEGDFSWVTGTAAGEIWQGVLLEQPNGTKVLGARAQVSPTGPNLQKREATWTALTGDVLEGGKVKDPKRLLEMLQAGSITVGLLEKIARGPQRLEVWLVVDGPAQLQTTAVDVKPLLEAVR